MSRYYNDDNWKFGCGMMSVIMVILLIMAALSPLCCTDPTGATRALEVNNYTDIELHGYRWFAGSDDVYITEFEATAPNGERVTGIVTNGFWRKGSTIRID
jgi:hypothetical protein